MTAIIIVLAALWVTFTVFMVWVFKKVSKHEEVMSDIYRRALLNPKNPPT